MRFTQAHETRTVVQGGQEYHAQTAPTGSCAGGALYNPTGTPICIQPDVIKVTTCTPGRRADRSSVIWVKP